MTDDDTLLLAAIQGGLSRLLARSGPDGPITIEPGKDAPFLLECVRQVDGARSDMDPPPPSHGFEHLQTFRGWLGGVKPSVGRGQTTVEFGCATLDMGEFTGILNASGQLLEVSVARKLYLPQESE